MDFMNEYPTQKSEQEQEAELKMKLETTMRNALKKTAKERTDGLVLTDEQIEKIISKVKEFKVDNIQKSAWTLEGILDKILKDSNDPEIEAIRAKQLEIYKAKQLAFRYTEEYAVAKEIYERHPNVMPKIMSAFDIVACERKEDGTVAIYCSCDESRLISKEQDNAAVVTKDGKTTIKVVEKDDGEKEL